MVMRNRGDGSDAPHWWDDLPPRVRERFTRPTTRTGHAESATQTQEPPPPVSTGDLIGAIAHLTLALALFVFGITLLLFAAIYFVHG